MKKENSLIKNGLLLISSGGMGQVIALLLLIIIGRLYDKEMMGVLGIFSAWGGVLAIIATGRYEQATIIADNEEEAKSTHKIATGFAFFFSLFTALVACIIYFLFPQQGLGNYIFALPLFIFISAYYTSLSLLFLRYKAYKRLSSSQFIRGVGNNLLKVLWGFISATIGGLISSIIISPILALIPLKKKGRKNHLADIFSSVKYTLPLLKASKNKEEKEVIKVARKFYKFPRYGVAQALIDTLLGSLLLMSLRAKYPLEVVGALNMAIMLARRPLSILSDNISRVYFQHLGELVREQHTIMPAIRKFLFYTFLIGIPTSILLYFSMDWLVTLFVSDKWLLSSFIIKAMLPMLLINVCCSTLNILPDVLGEQKSNLYAQILMLLFNILTIAIGFVFFSFEDFIVYFYLLMILEQGAYLIYLLQITRRYEAYRKK